MAQIKPRTLSGFMELLPARQVQFDRMVEILRKSYSLYGFTPLDTPAIEAAEVLLAKGGGETEKQIYRFTKGDSDLALRFDLTVPLAKYVALHQNELTFPFRRFQISKVYRGERAQKGRGDGSLNITNEAEIPSIIYKTFTALGLRRFKIRVNNRKVLNGLFAILGLEKQAGDVMRTIDKLEKIGPEKVRAILTDDFARRGGRRPARPPGRRRSHGRAGALQGEERAFRSRRGRAGDRDQVYVRLRRAGGALHGGSHHCPRPGLLHRHRV